MGLIPSSLWAVYGLVTLVHSDLSVNTGITPHNPQPSGVGWGEVGRLEANLLSILNALPG